MPKHTRGCSRWAPILLLAAAGACPAAPFKPGSDQQVLVRLPASVNAVRGGPQAERQRRLAQNPRQAELAAEVAGDHLMRLMADGDPRFAGYAQAAIAPWWDEPSPPPEVRVVRAVLRQFQHGFDAALADLDAVVRQDPTHVQAWAWIAAISMVQTRYDRARQACEAAAPHASALQASSCMATVDAATGRARPAALALQQALDAEPDADPALRLWALTRLAETHERLGDAAAAEAAYRQALALGLDDSYLLAAYADFLLDQGRPAEVLVLLSAPRAGPARPAPRGGSSKMAEPHLLENDRERNDLHLLRLALAGHALKHVGAGAWASDLTARFDAARQRGDTAHQKEEARFLLELKGDAARALPLAQANYAAQREAADARVLLQAALAARQKAAAAPVLQWLRQSGFESPTLRALAARVEALP